MNVVYFGFNALSSCLDVLIAQTDVQILAVYTGEDSSHTDQIYNLAEQNKLAVIAEKPTLAELTQWVEAGVECFICAEYPHKIPLPTDLKHAINIHPTLLPEGRGQTPLPQLILKYPQHAGVTLHKMTDEFDKGDLIISQALTVEADETFDSLHSKVFLTAPQLLQQVLTNFNPLMQAAKPQMGGSNWPSLGLEQQTIDWTMSVTNISRISRAFGSLGVKVCINQSDYFITIAQCVLVEHHYQMGDVVIFDDFKLTIACQDGVVIIPRPCLFSL